MDLVVATAELSEPMKRTTLRKIDWVVGSVWFIFGLEHAEHCTTFFGRTNSCSFVSGPFDAGCFDFRSWRRRDLRPPLGVLVPSNYDDCGAHYIHLMASV